MTKQTIITIIIIALIFFGIGFVFANYYKLDSNNNTYQAGWDAAKQRLEESGFVPMIEDMEITSVSGEVEQIQDNKISLSIYVLEPLADPSLDSRIIEVDENTKIYQLIEKNQEQLQKEMDEFNQKMQEQTNNPEITSEPIMPPELFNRQEISFNNLQIGQQITVLAQEDIKDKKEFKAVEINIQFMPEPAMPEPVDALPVE